MPSFRLQWDRGRDPRTWAKHVDQLNAKLSDFKPVFRRLLTPIVRQNYSKIWKTEGAELGKKWPPRKQKGEGSALLVLTGELKDAAIWGRHSYHKKRMAWEFGPKHAVPVEYGTTRRKRPKGASHKKGAALLASGGKYRIPPRPYAELSQRTRKHIAYVLHQHIDKTIAETLKLEPRGRWG